MKIPFPFSCFSKIFVDNSEEKFFRIILLLNSIFRLFLFKNACNMEKNFSFFFCAICLDLVYATTEGHKNFVQILKCSYFYTWVELVGYELFNFIWKRQKIRKSNPYIGAHNLNILKETIKECVFIWNYKFLIYL